MSRTTNIYGISAPVVNVTHPTPTNSIIVGGSSGTNETSKEQPRNLGPFSGISRRSSSLTRHAGTKFDDNETEGRESTGIERDSVSIVLSQQPESENTAAKDGKVEILVKKSSDALTVQSPLIVHSPLGVLTPTEGGLTTCDDGGRTFEADFLAENEDMVNERTYDSGHSVIEQVRDDLDATSVKLQSAIDPKSWYISCTSLHAIMTFKTACLLLHEIDAGMSQSYVEQVAEEIAPPLSRRYATSFRRIFAILILIRKPKAILELHARSLDDSQLCKFDSEPSSGSPLHPMLEFFRDAKWKDGDIRDFCRVQWEVWPVFFSVTGRKVIHYECRAGEILPFRKINQKIMKGGYGEVACYELHPHQQTLVRYTVSILDLCTYYYTQYVS